MLEVPATNKVVVEEPNTFSYREGIDKYMKVVSVLDEKGVQVCSITNAPGRCCAVSILGNLSSFGFWNDREKVDAFVEEMKWHWRERRCFRVTGSGYNLSNFNISGFYVYLSEETAHYDKALREHPDIKLVHTFTNKRCACGDSSYQGNIIYLYYMEF